MKHVLSLLLAVLVISGCVREEPKLESKLVLKKLASTEQRLSFDMFDKQTFRTRAQTVYYLIASDGTLARVSMSVYAKTKVGDEVGAQWIKPE